MTDKTLDYTPIERVTRTDFTAEELFDHINSGDAQTINNEYRKNPNYNTESEIWRDKVNELQARLGPDWHRSDEYEELVKTHMPSYYISENGDWKVFGEELVELEDWFYEGGYIHGFGHFTTLDNGNLGDGHDAWNLFKHEESGRLFRLGGWYSSWDSGEWNELVEVEPAKQTVQRYKPLGSPDDKAFEYPAVTVKD